MRYLLNTYNYRQRSSKSDKHFYSTRRYCSGLVNELKNTGDEVWKEFSLSFMHNKYKLEVANDRISHICLFIVK